jgi:hypothetical protein
VLGYETLLSTTLNLPSNSILNPGKVKSGKHHIREVMTGKHETLEHLIQHTGSGTFIYRAFSV